MQTFIGWARGGTLDGRLIQTGRDYYRNILRKDGALSEDDPFDIEVYQYRDHEDGADFVGIFAYESVIVYSDEDA
jgi:hypothetical protein